MSDAAAPVAARVTPALIAIATDSAALSTSDDAPPPTDAADPSTATDAATADDAMLPADATLAASADGQPGKKRKLDKQEKRAAHKLRKKARQEHHRQQEDAEPSACNADDAVASSVAPARGGARGTQKRAGAVSDESVLESAYFFQGGNRLVFPYWYEFSTYAKRRWLGQPIIQVLKSEYGNGGKGTDESETENYYRAAIDSGAFRIEGAKITCEHIVREGDHFQHYQHRHETPVTADPIIVHYQDANLIVIDKPSSIPVHPCGNYRHNTVLYILAKEHALRTVFVIHRLDAVTSGLLILAKNANTARRLSQQISDKEVRKEYIARVQGHFPEDMQDYVLSVHIYQHTVNGQSVLTTTPPPTPAPNASIAAPPRPASDQVADASKESITVFSFLSYDAATNSSLVKCCPLTGRTHQIRLHLQHLGYPIANDVRYGGHDASTGQANDLATIQLPRDEQASASSTQESMPAAAFDAPTYWRDTAARKRQLQSETEAQRLQRIEAESVDSSLSCPICQQAQAAAATPGVSVAASSSAVGTSSAPTDLLVDADSMNSPFSSTRVRVEYIWLHAFKYSYDPAFKNTCRPTASAPIAPATPPATATATLPSASTSSPANNLTSVVAASTTPSPLLTSPGVAHGAHWSYEIPWPSWAIQIAPPAMQQHHQRVQVQK